MSKTKSQTFPSHTMQATSNKDVDRFCNLEGDWNYYYHKPSKQFLVSITHFLGKAYPKGEGFNQWLLSHSKEDAAKILEERGDAGAKVHEAIKLLLDGKEVERDRKFRNRVTDRQEELGIGDWFALESWVNFQIKYQPKLIKHEQTVASLVHKFAGTFDFFGTITVPEGDRAFDKAFWGKEILVLLDWKFTSGIWDSYKAQGASYLESIKEGKEYDDFLAAFKGRTLSGVVRLGTKHKAGFEIKCWTEDETQEHFDLAAHALALFRSTEGALPEVREIPSSFKVEIPKVTLPKKKVRAVKKTAAKKTARKAAKKRAIKASE